MENTSGLVPLGRAVLVQNCELDDKRGKDSKIFIPDDVKSSSAQVEQKAIVIAVGNSCWDDEKEPRAKPGDKVLITKFAGYVAKGTLDGKTYRLVNDRDIFARVEQEAS